MWLRTALRAEPVLYRGAVTIKPPFEMGVANLTAVNAKHSMMKRQYFTANSIFEKEFEMPNAMYDWLIG